jgi:hypothetical protein
VDLSGAHELAADSAQYFLKVLVESSERAQSFRRPVSTLVTVGHFVITP